MPKSVSNVQKSIDDVYIRNFLWVASMSQVLRIDSEDRLLLLK